jgi:hypothetical protein
MSRSEFRHDGCAILQALADKLGVSGVVRYGYTGGGGERVFFLSTGVMDAPRFLSESVVGSALTLHRFAAQRREEKS